MSSKHIASAYEYPTEQTTWIKSAYSDHGNACVEWQLVGEQVLIRDSKYRGNENVRPVITVPANTWDAFLAVAADNEMHLSDARPELPAIRFDTTSAETSLIDTLGTTLTFTAMEWDAFTKSIRTQHWQLAAV